MNSTDDLVYSLSATTTNYGTTIYLNYKELLTVGDGSGTEVNWELLLELADAYRSTL